MSKQDQIARFETYFLNDKVFRLEKLPKKCRATHVLIKDDDPTLLEMKLIIENSSQSWDARILH